VQRPGLLDAVIFDWGGTLTPHADVAMSDMWEHAGLALAPERADEAARVLTDVEAETWDRVGVDQASARLEDIILEAARRLDLRAPSALLADVAEGHLGTWRPIIHHDAEALPVLAGLRKAGFRLGLLSNTHWPPEFIEGFLARDGLDAVVEARVYSSELPRTKPHPMAFKAVLHLLDVPDPRRAVFIGDRLFDDIHGAQQMGMRTVLRRSAADGGTWPDGSAVLRSEVRPDATIDRLSELPHWVEAWT